MNAYENTRERFAGETPPPWSRMRSDSERRGDVSAVLEGVPVGFGSDVNCGCIDGTGWGFGGREIVIRIGGKSSEVLGPCCFQWCSTVARNAFFISSEIIYWKCEGTYLCVITADKK